MGILNVTPDSFADGGAHFDARARRRGGLRMAADGADIIDIGGESTRPGAEPLPEAEELRARAAGHRAAGAATSAVPHLHRHLQGAGRPRSAIERGATIVNDISGLLYDPALGRSPRRRGAALILMHTRGRSARHTRSRRSTRIRRGTSRGSWRRRSIARPRAGVSRDAIIVDPGLGFAKRPNTATTCWRASTRWPRSTARSCRGRRASRS